MNGGTDSSNSRQCCLRLGKRWMQMNSVSQSTCTSSQLAWTAIWSDAFPPSSPGCIARELYLRAAESRLPSRVFSVGIEIRPGRGRYRHTQLVICSPRFLLCNRSAHRLAYLQRPLVNDRDSGYTLSTTAPPNSNQAFHWPHHDKDKHLAVRLDDVVDCGWSGGFTIDEVNSFHVIMRSQSTSGQSRFLRVEVTMNRATFHVIFSDINHLPLPYRIENKSAVALTYWQTEVADLGLRSTVRPFSSVPYALDEPTLPAHITLGVPGGTRGTYDINRVCAGAELHYEHLHDVVVTCSIDCPTGELVFDLSSPDSQSISLHTKQPGLRNQLWRWLPVSSGFGVLMHEGSIPPQEPTVPNSPPNGPVLDVSCLAPRPARSTYEPLCLRKRDPQRRWTQEWCATDEGRLVCRAGLFVHCTSLRAGSAVLAGPADSAVVHSDLTTLLIRPTLGGSGTLSVCVSTDGPTRVLRIEDAVAQKALDETEKAAEAREDSDDWICLVSEAVSPKAHQGSKNLLVRVALPQGFGVSLVNHTPEELLYITFKDVALTIQRSGDWEDVSLTLGRLQVDNQLLDTSFPLLLYHSVNTTQNADARVESVLSLSWRRDLAPRWNAEIFQLLHLYVKRLSLCLEEKVLWKTLQFFNVHLMAEDREAEVEELEFSAHQRAINEVASTCLNSRRYYIGSLLIHTGRISISVHRPASELPPDLRHVKEALNARHLVSFEDARVEFEPFRREHPFETANLLLREVLLHYSREVRSNAVMILGSVDFLGNPIGLLTDLTEGITGLITDGNVKGLVKGVFHGVSNTTAKVTGSISDGLTILNMDERHLAKRGKLREQASKHGGLRDHWSAGVKGLGYGLVGGLTSIITQPYYGATERGFEGFVYGVGKGLIGTVTKPVAGVLDLASEVSSGIRDRTSRLNVDYYERMRPPRCPSGLDRLLKLYQFDDAFWQAVLYSLNGGQFSERYLTSICIRTSTANWVLLSDRGVYLVRYTDKPSKDSLVMEAKFSEMIYCRPHAPVSSSSSPTSPFPHTEYLEFNIANRSARARVRCESPETVIRAVTTINHGLELYREECSQLR